MADPAAGAAVETAWEWVVGAGADDGRLVEASATPSRAAQTVEIPASLDPSLAAALRGAGIDPLFSHQVEAFEVAREGNLIDRDDPNCQ